MSTVKKILILFTIYINVSYGQFTDDLRITPNSTFHQTENSIAIDPTNPNNLIIACVGEPDGFGGYKTPHFYSNDGGLSWEGSEESPNGLLTKGDPFVIFNQYGDAFFINKSNSGINFLKSTDKGVSWITKPKLSNDVVDDKPHFTTGRSVSTKDHIYAVWTEADPEQFTVQFRRSTNRGETFEGTHNIYSSTNEYEGLGSYVAAGPEGNVYVAFVKLIKGSGLQSQILLYRSTDAGITFSQNPIAQFALQGMNSPNTPNANFNGIRINSFPYIATDNNGTVYIVYTNNKASSGGDIHNFLRKSSNQGLSWTSQIEIPSGSTGIRQWFPSIAIDASDQSLYVSYYNMVSESPSFNTYRNVAKSTNGGSSFIVTQISDVSFIPQGSINSSFMGDYYEIKALNGIAYDCWSDNRSGKFQIYISPIGGAEVDLDQVLSNNSSFGKVDRWNGLLFKNLDVQKRYHVRTDISHTFRSNPNINSQEKYYRWRDENIINYRTYNFPLGVTEVTSEFHPTNEGITIQNYFADAPSLNPIDDKIKFIDPWLADLEISPYGKRNRGMELAFDWQRLSPFYPDYETSYNGNVYQGVFLNQGYNPVNQTWTPPYYAAKVDAVQDINLLTTGYPSGSGRNHKFYFQNWNRNFISGQSGAEFQDSLSLQTPVVFKYQNAIIQANLKGTQLTNTQFNGKSGQRSFIKDNVLGYLHNVYESMGKIWYERSTNKGASWELMNDGKPINPSANAKSPSVCQYSGQSYLYVVYQASGTWWPQVETDGILVTIFQLSTSANVLPLSTLSVQVPNYNYSNDYRPVIAAHAGSGVVVYDMPAAITPGLKGFYFSINTNTNLMSLNGDITFPANFVDQNSSNPSIASDYTRTHLVFEQGQTQVKYVLWNSGGSVACSTIVSSSSGSIYNLKPVISLLGFQNSSPVISWIGGTYNYYGGYIPTNVLTRILSINYDPQPPGPPVITLGIINNVTGNIQSVSSASNNYTVQNPQKTLITWSYLSGSTSYSRWQRREGTVYTAPASMYFNIEPYNSFPINGIWTQATTDEAFTSPTALVFNTVSQPYYFIPSTTNFTSGNSSEAGITQKTNGNIPLGKITEEDTILTFGRSGVASINDIEFVFEIGDIIVGDSIIKFIEIPDTLAYNSTSELNQHTRTNNFTLNPVTNFYFSNIYYVVQKSDPAAALTTSDAVHFKAELVNAITNQVIGTFDNITYNKTNLEKYASIDYEVDCSGITVGEYYLRLVTTVNGNANYTLANIFNDNTTLAKKNYNKVNFAGSEIPITYDLAQNFPNPFNPSTTIRYQIPQDGIVTLKIYDILGSEVATLVNEEKLAGKYEVNFNASALASGVYIYKIQAGSFVNSKKMLLLK